MECGKRGGVEFGDESIDWVREIFLSAALGTLNDVNVSSSPASIDIRGIEREAEASANEDIEPPFLRTPFPDSSIFVLPLWSFRCVSRVESGVVTDSPSTSVIGLKLG